MQIANTKKQKNYRWISLQLLKINDNSKITDYKQAESTLKTALASAKRKSRKSKKDLEKLNAC